MERGKALLASSLLACVVGCSSSSASGPTGPLPDDENWQDGKVIGTSITVAAGTTITIEPGASITMGKGVTITVLGKLQASSRAAHVKLNGASWGGIVVDQGGALDFDGVDLTNADSALAIKSGTASYQYGTIANAVPFTVQQDGQLTTAHSTVTGAKSGSQISGTFTATFLDYDAGQGEGIVGADPGASISIEDSKLHGHATEDNDLIITHAGAAHVRVAYVDLAQAHCGIHFDAVTAFDVSYTQIHDGAYGAMLYGSASGGARAITSTNIFKNKALGVDEGNPNTVNGVISISNGYWGQNGSTADDNIHEFTGQIKTSNMSTSAPISGTGPRGAVP